ncbi:MAG TPA: HAD family hydrolase [Thermoplasmata archaeon]|nr:HAD family hydrolase [Thermoplasmata archaeon]
MSLPYGRDAIDAVVLGVEDVLVPLRTPSAWQWAWRPQGPLLGERRVHAAMRRTLRAWDRRRWRGLTGVETPADAGALEAHLKAALFALAGHPLPADEADAVVRRLMHPAGAPERFADVEPALRRLDAAGVTVGAVTGLPEESARWLLGRAALGTVPLMLPGDSPAGLPERAAYRAIASSIEVPIARIAFVGGLFWSDVRAAARAGAAALLLDRFDVWPKVGHGRILKLEALERALQSGGSPSPPAEPPGAPQP